MLQKFIRNKFLFLGFLILFFLLGRSTFSANPSTIDNLFSIWRSYVNTENGETKIVTTTPSKINVPVKKLSTTSVTKNTATQITNESLVTALRSLIVNGGLPEDIRNSLRGRDGQQGLAGPQGPSGPSSGSGYAFASASPTTQNNPGPIGLIGGFASLGVQDLNTTNINITNNITQTGGTTSLSSLNVTGGTTFNGSLNLSGLLSFSGTDTAGLKLKNLTTVERDALTASTGLAFFNTTAGKMQVYNGVTWKNVGNPEIGGEVTSGTTGSILFVDGSNNLAQDNTNFFWDDTTNRLGIGTNSPATTLDVNGVTTFRGNIIAGTDNTYDIGASGATRPRTGYFGTSVVAPTITATSALNSNGNLTITKADPSIILDTTTATDTDFWLSVTEDAGSDDDDLFQIGDGASPGTNPFLTINTSGQVGVGTTAPDARLDVYNSGAYQALFRGYYGSVSSVFNGEIRIGESTTFHGRIGYDGQSSGRMFIENAGTGGIFFRNDLLGTPKTSMVILSDGNVGIGTTVPSRKLTINSILSGDSQISLFRHQHPVNFVAGDELGSYNFGGLDADSSPLNDDAIRIVGSAHGDWTATSSPAYLTFETTPVSSITALPRMTIAADGNVGIGTTNPNNTIQVANLINFDNTDFNTRLGYTAGGNIVTGAQYNTYLGYESGLSGSGTSTNAADENTAVGYRTMYSNTTGSRNTAIGYSSLKNNGAGSGNTSLGYTTLESNVSGSYNTAMGYQALQVTTTDYNTAIGGFALKSNTLGSGNTGIGSLSLTANQTGSNNVAIGVSILNSSTDGSQNVAMGAGAFYHNSSSDNNVGIGFEAGIGTGAYSNEGGVYLGHSAGFSAATGSDYNTMLGFRAGYSTTTGGYNIAIGQRVDLPSATGSQQLNIGNVLYGTGLYNGGSVSSTPVAGGKIGIGTTNPARLLEVTGNLTHSATGDAAQISVSGTVTPGKKLNLGFDTTSDYGFIEAIYVGTQVRPLVFNPVGGSVGIGTTNPVTTFQLSGITSVGGTSEPTYDGDLALARTYDGPEALGGINFKNANSYGTKLYTNNTNKYFGIASRYNSATWTEHLVVKQQTGNVGIGITNPSNQLHVVNSVDNLAIAYFQNSHATNPYGIALNFTAASPDNNTNYFITASDSTATRFIVYSDGDIQNHDNSYGGISDARLKENIVSAPSYLGLINQVGIKRFSFKEDHKTEADDVGVIAQELEFIFPEFVTTNTETGYKAVTYSKFTPVLIKTVQELDLKIEGIEDRVSALEANALSGGGGLTGMAADFFNAGVQSVVDGIVYMKGIVTEKLTVGSPTKRTGVTFYDEVTGDPYCMSVANGSQKIVNGECTIIEVAPPAPSGGGGGDNPTDTTPPVITLTGDATVQVSLGGVYEELGATATDETDGSLVVNITGSVDVNTLGSYTINYNVSDLAGNIAIEVTRTVNVIE